MVAKGRTRPGLDDSVRYSTMNRTVCKHHTFPHSPPVSKGMKSVIHLLSGDETEQETALAIARNLLEDETGSIEDVAIVVQADGVNAITTGVETEDQVKALLDDGVSFKACRNTLDMMDLDESDVIEGIETVPEGAVEVTRLETDGYAYIRP